MEEIFQMDEDAMGVEPIEQKQESATQRFKFSSRRLKRDLAEGGSPHMASSCPPAAPVIGSMPATGMGIPQLSLPPSVEREDGVGYASNAVGVVCSFREDYVRAGCTARAPAPRG